MLDLACQSANLSHYVKWNSQHMNNWNRNVQKIGNG